jgi:hypothetical protein
MAHRMTKFLSASLGALLVLASSTTADTTKKAAWQLTLEERAAARQAEIARQRGTADGRGDDLRAVHISGDTTPELFLPIELFRRLMLVSFSSNPDGRAFVRGRMLERATGAGITLPDDFWPRLESAGTAYLESLRTVERLSKTIDSPSGRDRTNGMKALRVLKASQCELRETALNNARAEFGST